MPSSQKQTVAGQPSPSAHCDAELVVEGYFVRVGTLGVIGRMRWTEPQALRNGQRVLCRTARGLEFGKVLREARWTSHGAAFSDDGLIVRPMAAQDELLWAHLQRLGSDAQQRCDAWLAENRPLVTLLDVEPLMDGKTLYFHFLTEVDAGLQEELDALVAIYEREVRESQFAQLLEHGCGPGCGTDEAENGCGSSGGCAVCKIANECHGR